MTRTRLESERMVMAMRCDVDVTLMLVLDVRGPYFGQDGDDGRDVLIRLAYGKYKMKW